MAVGFYRKEIIGVYVMKIYLASSAPQGDRKIYDHIEKRMLSYYHVKTKTFSSDIVFEAIKEGKKSNPKLIRRKKIEN